MASFPYSQFHADAADALGGAAYSPKKLVLIHTGVSAAVGLVLSLFSYILDLGIAHTGGLSGIHARSTLETVQTLLVYANTLLMPFWQIGYLFCTLRLIRRQEAAPRGLFSGFRHFGPVLRGMLLRAMVCFPFLFAGAQIGYFLFLMSPGAQPMLDKLQEMVSSGTIDPTAMAPVIPFMAAGGLLLLIPVLYRLRMVDYALMDEPEKGAFYALLRSLKLTKGRCTALLKLDLHFWWYYALEVLIMALGYGDLILTLLGIELGISAGAAALVFYLAALICQLALHLWRKNTVFTTYALAYEALNQAPDTAAQPPNVPWNYK